MVRPFGDDNGCFRVVQGLQGRSFGQQGCSLRLPFLLLYGLLLLDGLDHPLSRRAIFEREFGQYFADVVNLLTKLQYERFLTMETL